MDNFLDVLGQAAIIATVLLAIFISLLVLLTKEYLNGEDNEI